MTSPSNLSTMYCTLRTMALQDPIFRAVMNGNITWDEAFTAADENAYQEYCANGEGANIIASVEQYRKRRVETTESVQIQRVTTTVVFNPNQVKTIVARNLPRDATPDELRAIFEKHGPVRDIYIPKNTDQNSPYYGTIKGFALIKYMSHTDSTRAFLAETTRLILRGKMIGLEFAKEDR